MSGSETERQSGERQRERDRDGRGAPSHRRGHKLRLFYPPEFALLPLATPPSPRHQKLNLPLFAFALVNRPPPTAACRELLSLARSLLQFCLRVIELSLSFDFRTSCERVGRSCASAIGGQGDSLATKPSAQRQHKHINLLSAAPAASKTLPPILSVIAII